MKLANAETQSPAKLRGIVARMGLFYVPFRIDLPKAFTNAFGVCMFIIYPLMRINSQRF
jgi:hypothetical protein